VVAEVERSVADADTELERSVADADTELERSVADADTELERSVADADTELERSVADADTERVSPSVSRGVGDGDGLGRKSFGFGITGSAEMVRLIVDGVRDTSVANESPRCSQIASDLTWPLHVAVRKDVPELHMEDIRRRICMLLLYRIRKVNSEPPSLVLVIEQFSQGFCDHTHTIRMLIP
jgi:hypothetical protein